MSTYRVDWTEIKPGGTEARQSDAVRGERRDVVVFLGRLARIKSGTVNVTEHTTSDGHGTGLGDLGFGR